MNDSSHWKWLWWQLRPVLSYHFTGLCLIAFSSAGFVLDPLILKWLIDTVLPKKEMPLLLVAATAIGSLALLQLLFSASGGILSVKAVQDLICSIRLRIFDQMSLLSADFHERVPHGEKLCTLQQDVEEVAEMGSTIIPAVFQTICLAVCILAAMFVLSYRMTCMLLPLLPLFLLVKKHYDDRLDCASDAVRRELSKDSSFLQEHLASAIPIQLLNIQQIRRRTFIVNSMGRMRAVSARTREEILFRTWSMGLVVVGQVLILVYGGYQSFCGALTIGGFVAFYSYFVRLFSPLSTALDIYARLGRLNVSLQRIFTCMMERPSISEPETPYNLQLATSPRIDMADVCFGYTKGAPILCELTLHIEAGEKLALVGVSGSGKSTIMKLLARLHDVELGQICVDGVDIRQLTLSNLRTAICLVTQDPVFFDMTLKENLLLGSPNASDDEMSEVIELVGLTSLLRSVPNGWDTFIGPRGTTLSTGERQRLAVARAVLKKPSVLLLDESTSGLDVISERHVYFNVTRHLTGKTVIVISHRIAALTWVDRIAVVNKGTIEEIGIHEQLLRNQKLYSHLYKASLHSDDIARGPCLVGVS